MEEEFSCFALLLVLDFRDLDAFPILGLRRRLLFSVGGVIEIRRERKVERVALLLAKTEDEADAGKEGDIEELLEEDGAPFGDAEQLQDGYHQLSEHVRDDDIPEAPVVRPERRVFL